MSFLGDLVSGFIGDGFLSDDNENCSFESCQSDTDHADRVYMDSEGSITRNPSDTRVDVNMSGLLDN